MSKGKVYRCVSESLWHNLELWAFLWALGYFYSIIEVREVPEGALPTIISVIPFEPGLFCFVISFFANCICKTGVFAKCSYLLNVQHAEHDGDF